MGIFKKEFEDLVDRVGDREAARIVAENAQKAMEQARREAGKESRK